MTTPDWPTVATSVGSSILALAGAIAGKMGVDKVRGGNGSALKEKVEAKLDTLGEKMDAFSEKVDSKLGAIQSDLADTKAKVAEIQGWRKGRSEGLTEALRE